MVASIKLDGTYLAGSTRDRLVPQITTREARLSR
jgi:hypothetical protein